MLKEFKEFALRGNVVDMAVGIIIGAAFSTIVRSLVDDIIMPPIGVVTGGVDFSNMFVALNGEHYDSLAQARQAGAPTVNIGLFINNVISFMIVAFVLFMAIKAHEPVAPQAGGGAGHRAAAVAGGGAAPGNPRCLGGGRFGPEAGAGSALAGPRPSKDFARAAPAAAASLRAWAITQKISIFSAICGNDFAAFRRRNPY